LLEFWHSRLQHPLSRLSLPSVVARTKTSQRHALWESWQLLACARSRLFISHAITVGITRSIMGPSRSK
jgi:hypothetical protein